VMHNLPMRETNVSRWVPVDWQLVRLEQSDLTRL